MTEAEKYAEIVRDAVRAELDYRDSRGLDRKESLTWLTKQVRNRMMFPRNLDDARKEFVRLGFVIEEVPFGNRGIRTYISEPKKVE
jgi:hypothetical protein